MNDREVVRSFLNETYKEQEVLNKFDLMRCPLCNNAELEEDMVYHKWDLGQVEEKICESCRNDE